MNLRLPVIIFSIFCFSCNSNGQFNSVVVDKNEAMQNVSDKTDIALIDWVEKMVQEEKPDSSIIAYNFGLFETPDGYTVYLIGSKEFDAENADWATNEDFKPANKYFPLFSKEYKNLKWNQVLIKVEDTIKEFMKSEVYKDSFLAKAKAVTIGFDDGDLVRLK